MENNTVCVVALDKNTGYIGPVTSCAAEDAQRYAKYYRSIGYRAKVVDYDTLEEMQKRETAERRSAMHRYGGN